MECKKRDLAGNEDEEYNDQEELKVKPDKKKVKQVPSESSYQLGGKKKASVSMFKGKVLINIREYYEDKTTGEEKPGSKGIALTTEQWNALKEVVSDIT